MGTIAIVIALLIAVAVGAYFLFGRAKPDERSLPREGVPPEGKQTKPEDAPKKLESKKPDSTKAAEPKKAEPAKAEAKEDGLDKPRTPEKTQEKTPETAPEKASERASEKPEASAPEISVESDEPKPSSVVVARTAAVHAAPTKATSDADARERVAVLKKGLATTRGGFIARLAQLFGRKREIDPALLDEIQAVLITADIGPRTADKLLERLRERLGRSELRNEDAVWSALQQEGKALLAGGPTQGGIRLGPNGPTTILVIGVNGVGKTTTIGKLASHFKQDGKKVVLAAGDTFRAAAVLQLEVWAKRVGCDLVKGKDRADPSSVIFDAVRKAKAENLDVVIADTAGRLHTKSNLMEELKKVVRTAEKALERPVDEVLLVLDATTGQNAIQQAQLFKEAIAVSGIVLTKLDGTAKGGVVLGIVDEHHIPVRYVGIGERVEDLREFDPESFVSALFEKPEPEAVEA
jgi:fused signal recognition particle receptor